MCFCSVLVFDCRLVPLLNVANGQHACCCVIIFIFLAVIDNQKQRDSPLTKTHADKCSTICIYVCIFTSILITTGAVIVCMMCVCRGLCVLYYCVLCCCVICAMLCDIVHRYSYLYSTHQQHNCTWLLMMHIDSLLSREH
jgi:hypothetical protein